MTDRLAVEVVDHDPGRGPPRDAGRRRHRRRRGARRGVRGGRRDRRHARRPRLRRRRLHQLAPGSPSSSGCSPRRAATTATVIALGLSDHYREIFRITRLSDYLTIADPAPATSVPEEAAR